MATNGTTGSADLDMLIKLMGMTGSSNDNEALAALRLATKWLANRGHNWDDLLRGKVTVESDPFALQPPKPAAAAWTQPTPQYRAPPPPPPPPTKWTNATTIQDYFDQLEFVTLPSYILTRLNQIEVTFKTQHFLYDNDYNYLKTQATTYAPKTRKRRRTR
jgi:hypothetical protein